MRAVQDVLWQNVGLSSSGYLGAAVLAWTLFSLLAIFYLIPVGAVQALLQVDKLERFKFFKVIMDVSQHSSHCCSGCSCFRCWSSVMLGRSAYVWSPVHLLLLKPVAVVA